MGISIFNLYLSDEIPIVVITLHRRGDTYHSYTQLWTSSWLLRVMTRNSGYLTLLNYSLRVESQRAKYASTRLDLSTRLLSLGEWTSYVIHIRVYGSVQSISVACSYLLSGAVFIYYTWFLSTIATFDTHPLVSEVILLFSMEASVEYPSAPLCIDTQGQSHLRRADSEQGPHGGLSLLV